LVPLSSADLLVNARAEPSVGMAIEREIHSADRIDLLCAFVRWNGLRIIRPVLVVHRDAVAGNSLRRVFDAEMQGGDSTTAPVQAVITRPFHVTGR
jgi:hypothetical protein